MDNIPPEVIDAQPKGYFTLTGALMAVLCFYVLFGRLLGMYIFDKTGSTGLRRKLIVQVVVLGDIGRSPRMRYHATALANSNCQVDLIGYLESDLGASIRMNRFIRVRPIRQAWSVPEGLPKICYILWAPFKAIFLCIQLFWTMGCISQSPDFIIVQNPPSIPTLMVGQLVGKLRKAWFIIDWHNFGYSILNMRVGSNSNHPMVKFALWYEKKFGHTAFAHLTVTDTMNRELQDKWKVEGKVITVRDKPQSEFRRLDVQQIHRHFTYSLKMIEDAVKEETVDGEAFLGEFTDRKLGTLLTDADEKGYLKWREDRPRLIVSSTSWTEDEDFSVLLKAVELYEAAAKPTDPRLLFVITGNGPLKKFYQAKIKTLDLKKTRIITAWLAPGDYPLLLGSADLGVSLHTSTSGMDLPMKVVDMFGCGLPVCAISFRCLDELVHDGQNGLVFQNSEDLAEQFMELFVKNPGKLNQLRANVIEEYRNNTWQKQYKDLIVDLFGQNAE